jgi:hypothetical protein
MVIGDGAFFEGHEVLIVERVRALAADDVDAALEELQPNRAGRRACTDRRAIK